MCLNIASANISCRIHSPSFGLFRIWAFPTHHLWHYFFSFWPFVQTLGRGRTVGSLWSSSAPPFLGRSRWAPPPLFAWKRENLRIKRKILPLMQLFCSIKSLIIFYMIYGTVYSFLYAICFSHSNHIFFC